MATTKASRLAAVNTIISNVGQAPVTGLETGNPLVEMAEQILDEITRSVLAEGWEHNTERGYPFTPDATGQHRLSLSTSSLLMTLSPGSVSRP